MLVSSTGGGPVAVVTEGSESASHEMLNSVPNNSNNNNINQEGRFLELLIFKSTTRFTMNDVAQNQEKR